MCKYVYVCAAVGELVSVCVCKSAIQCTHNLFNYWEFVKTIKTNISDGDSSEYLFTNR